MFQAAFVILASTQMSATTDSGYLGVRVTEEAGRVVVATVASDSPAKRVLREGDVVIELAGIPVTTARAFEAVMNRTRPGERLTIVIEGPSGPIMNEVVLALQEGTPVGRASGEPTVRYAVDRDQPTFAKGQLVLSAQGPGVDEYGISIGAAYSDKRPFVDFRYVQGLADILSLDIALQTYGVQNHLDLGLRFHLVSGDGFSLALRARLHEEHYLEGNDLFLASVSPGVMISFGSERMQWTLGLDAHVYLFAWIEGFPGRFDYVAYGFRPFVGFEYAVTDTMNLFVEAQVRSFQIDGFDTIVEPGLSAGFAW